MKRRTALALIASLPVAHLARAQSAGNGVRFEPLLRNADALSSLKAVIVSVDGGALIVEGLDAVDGTPVLDIKPAMTEFAPRGDHRQPDWVAELMADYWLEAPGT